MRPLSSPPSAHPSFGKQSRCYAICHDACLPVAECCATAADIALLPELIYLCITSSSVVPGCLQWPYTAFLLWACHPELSLSGSFLFFSKFNHKNFPLFYKFVLLEFNTQIYSLSRTAILPCPFKP